MEFEVEKTVSYWLEGAEYERGVADAMFQTGKYPYALFFGHLAIEKVLKALVVQGTREHAPYTHSLPLLVSKLTSKIPEEIEKKLVVFMEFYSEARYPEEQMKFHQKCTKDFAEQNLNEVNKVFKWLKQRLREN
jgi:HEPN domain-containing protein